MGVYLMIHIKQHRKLINHYRTLEILSVDDNLNNCKKDVLRILNKDTNEEIINLDITPDGIIHIWSNNYNLKVDKDA
jgi:hypothetical protein